MKPNNQMVQIKRADNGYIVTLLEWDSEIDFWHPVNNYVYTDKQDLLFAISDHIGVMAV